MNFIGNGREEGRESMKTVEVTKKDYNYCGNGIFVKKEKTISAEEPLKKKPGSKPKVEREKKKKYKECLYVHLRFPEKYEDVYHEIVRIAEVEHRTVIMQIVHFLRQGIDAYNEKKGEGK